MDSDPAPLSDRLAKLIPTRTSIILEVIAGLIVFGAMIGLIALEPRLIGLSLLMSIFGMSLLARAVAEILPGRRIRTAVAELRSAEQSDARADASAIIQRARPSVPTIVIALAASVVFLIASIHYAGSDRTIFDVTIRFLLVVNLLVLVSTIAIFLVCTRITINYWAWHGIRRNGAAVQMPLFYRVLDRLGSVLSKP